jgi:hypothetical protein
MQLYIFWASLCLGLIKLAAEPRRQEQERKAPAAIKQRRAARRN